MIKIPPGVTIWARGKRYRGEVPDHLSHLVALIPGHKDKSESKNKALNEFKKELIEAKDKSVNDKAG